MKKTNLTALQTAWNKVGEARGLLEWARDCTEDVLNDEQEVFDSRSEKWQESERGEQAQEQLDTLQSILDAINNSYDNDTDEVVGYYAELIENS